MSSQDQRFGKCMVHEKTHSSVEGLGRFGVIPDSHRALISEMSSWK